MRDLSTRFALHLNALVNLSYVGKKPASRAAEGQHLLPHLQELLDHPQLVIPSQVREFSQDLMWGFAAGEPVPTSFNTDDPDYFPEERTMNVLTWIHNHNCFSTCFTRSFHNVPYTPRLNWQPGDAWVSLWSLQYVQSWVPFLSDDEGRVFYTPLEYSTYQQQWKQEKQRHTLPDYHTFMQALCWSKLASLEQMLRSYRTQYSAPV